MPIEMSRDEFIGWLQPAMDLIHEDDEDPRIYISEARDGSLSIRVVRNREVHMNLFPLGTEMAGPMRTSWYSPDWLADLLFDVKILDVITCTVEVLDTGLRITVCCKSGSVIQYNILAHFCKTHFADAPRRPA